MASLFTPKERLLTPPHAVSLDESLPLIFIAGPIQGARDYQTPFAHSIIAETESTFVASPRRTEIDPNFNYSEQVSWEQINLARAAFHGVTAFWLEKRDTSIEYEAGRPFAKTTFGELNFAFGRKYENPTIAISLGIHPEYSESGGISERYIRELASAADVPIMDSIDNLKTDVLTKLT